MQTRNICIPAFAGTSAMTVFSYLVSAGKDENLREPEVLEQLISRLPNSCSKDSAQVIAWCTHYAVGVFFVVVYNKMWEQKKIQPSLISGALMGAASGIAGVIAWKLSFEIHPNPPAKNLKRYFGHLLLAHVVFGIVSALTYTHHPLRLSSKRPR